MVLDVAGLVIGLGSLALGIVQAIRLQRTNDALEQERRRLTRALLMNSSRDLRDAESELLTAIEHDSRQETVAAVRRFRDAAVNVQSHAKAAGGSTSLEDALVLMFGSLSFAFTDVEEQGPRTLYSTLIPRVSECCREAQSAANAMIVRSPNAE